MSEFNLNTTLLSNMEVLSCLGKKGAASVYLVRSSKSDQFYVLKHISVPETQRQVEALLFTGAVADSEAAQAYYQQVVQDYQTELELMQKLANSPNLDCFRSYEIKPKEDGIGFDVFLTSEYRNTLERHMADNPMTHAGAVNLAIDLCSALQDLRDAELIHRDVTPSNIYLNAQGHFMLADLGVASVPELKYCAMPEGMLSPYSAPELFDLMANVNETIDLYALGLILYRIYNGNHAPFEDEKTSAKAADRMRITGQELPTPMFADYEMAEILRKACAFHPEDRYQTPAELKEALVDYMKRNQVGDDPIVPPIQAEETQIDPDSAEEEVEPVQFASADEIDADFKESFSPDNDMLASLIESAHREMDEDLDIDYDDTVDEAQRMEDSLQKARNRKSRNKWIPTILAAVLVVAILATAVWFLFLKPETITIDSMEVTGQTLDSLTVSIVTSEDPTSFEVVCSDAYGYEERQAYTGSPNVFTGLVSGSQYTVSLSGLRNVEFEGALSITGTTVSTTNIISFTVSRYTVSELEISLIADGKEPEEWTVAYGPAGQEAKTKVFSGHTTVLTGLEPDTEYEITLMNPVNIQLSGATIIAGRTLPSVSMGKLEAVLSSSTATLTWTYTGATPKQWNVTTTGTDGYSDSQTVTDSSVILKDLQAGETYSILITCDNMEQAASTSITPNALRISNLKAEVNEAGDVDVTWESEAKSEDVKWLVVSKIKGDSANGIATQTAEPKATLTDLIPNTTYYIEIQEASGKQLGGDSTGIEFTTPAAEAFSDYGFGSAYATTWLRPNKENWTVNDLAGASRNTFSKTETVAFVCESINTPNDSDDAVSILLVVRDEEGGVVDRYSGDEVWNDMWNRRRYAGELSRTPQTPGTYSLEIYFNGKIVKASPITFEITE